MENNFAPHENYTPEEIERNIVAAFDSVDLINSLNSLSSLTEEEQDTKLRNIDHLQIMMAKEWFANGLTEEQTTIINQLID